MKQNVLKKFFIMLLTIILCTVSSIPETVQAASKITLKSGAAAPSSVYAGHIYALKVAGTTVKFYSSNKKVATIGLTTGKMKAVAPGTVKITAKSKKTGKVIATKSFQVLQRATAITSDPGELYLGAVGDTATLKATKIPAKSTDVVKFYTADKTIATVGMTSGKVTAKAEGKTTISVYAMATKATSKTSKYNKVATVDVYVGADIDSVTQMTTTDLEVTFKADVKEVKGTDFTVTNDTTKVTYPVKTATIDKKDAKKVTITTYADIKDGGMYTVTYGKSSGQFKATDGVVASIGISPTTVEYGKEMKIYVCDYDANGVQVGKYSKDTLPSDYELSIDVRDGYKIGEGALYFNSITSTAKASAKYHSTWKWEDGKEVGLLETGEVTITAKEIENPTDFQYTIAESASKIDFASSSYKQSTSIMVGDEDFSVFFCIKNSSNAEITNYDAYTVNSSDQNILSCSGTISNTTKSVDITPIKEGNAYILIKNALTKAVVTTLPVTVLEKKERIPSSIYIDKSTYTADCSLLKKEYESFTVKILDQYGLAIPKKNLFISQFGIRSDSTIENGYCLNDFVSQNGAEITIYTANMLGSYTFVVSYGKLASQKFTIEYKTPKGDICQKAVLYTDNASLENVLKEGSAAKSQLFEIDDMSDIKANVAIVTFHGNIPVKLEDVSEVGAKVSLKDKLGTELTNQYYKDGKLMIQSIEDSMLKTLPNDDYTITVMTGQKKELTSNFTVKAATEKTEDTSWIHSQEYWEKQYGEGWWWAYSAYCEEHGIDLELGW